jgi:5-hydroxyisourate hydrolase
MSAITTHVLDTSRGHPAPGVPVLLERRDAEGHWHPLGRGTTDADGRLRTLLPTGVRPAPGVYRLTFATGVYDRASFYPEVAVMFTVADPTQHYHVPLLLSPFGYSTYRGS